MEMRKPTMKMGKTGIGQRGSELHEKAAHAEKRGVVYVPPHRIEHPRISAARQQ